MILNSSDGGISLCSIPVSLLLLKATLICLPGWFDLDWWPGELVLQEIFGSFGNIWFHHISSKQVVSPGYRKFRLLCNYTWEREHCCQWHSSVGRSFFSFRSWRLYKWNKTKKKLPTWPEWLKSKTVFVSPVLLSWSLSDSENRMSYLVFPMLWTAALYGHVDKGFISRYHSNMKYNAFRSRYKRQR